MERTVDFGTWKASLLTQQSSLQPVDLDFPEILRSLNESIQLA